MQEERRVADSTGTVTGFQGRLNRDSMAVRWRDAITAKWLKPLLSSSGCGNVIADAVKSSDSKFLLQNGFNPFANLPASSGESEFA